MSDLTPCPREKLRKLAEAATPGPWVSGDPSFGNGNAQMIVSISDRAMGRDIQGPNLCPALFDVEFIVAANPADVLGLLDQLDAAEAKLAAAEAKLAAVRELHQPINAINEWVTCCECFDPADGGEWVQWPCPTIRALDEGIDHE